VVTVGSGVAGVAGVIGVSIGGFCPSGSAGLGFVGVATGVG
jgi:hypothetical protein